MRKCMTIAAVAAVVLTCVSGTQANVVMETVPVGNVGNTGDVQSQGIFGAVDYTYNIGKYEVTAGQYRDFLNAVDPTGANPYGLYNSLMNSDSYGCQITWNAESSSYDFSGRPSGTEADWTDRPVNYVSWGDSARFANWLHNGQGSGDTETGSYDLNGAMSDEDLMAVTRQADATWAIPTEDEWYKSAYHYNDGVTGNYFDYPTSSDSVPSNDLDGGGNNATFHDGDFTIGSPYYRTEFGAHVNSESPYDTFDQGGNVFEWNEAILYPEYGGYRGLRGGWFFFGVGPLHAANQGYHLPTAEFDSYGFRVAEVPEPAAIALLAFGAVGVLGRRGR